MRRPLLILALLAAVSLSACNVSLAADVTPPPDYQPPAAQPAALSVALPMLPPDPAAGEEIYIEKCLPCHGASGQGDGPQSANLPNPAAMLGSPELARQRRMTDWYAIVTQGNLQKFMPGFTASLSDRQRWDVVAYAFNLSLANEDLALGQSVYAENCARCHGETGAGDGPDAAALAGAVSSWAEPTRLAQLSAAEMSVITLGGSGQTMPAFSGKLTEEQVWAVSAHARALSFAPGAPAGQLAAQSPTTAPSAAQTQPAQPTSPAATTATGLSQSVRISGVLVNGSGGEIPAGAQVQLLGFDGMQTATEQAVEIQPDGSFVFEQVELVPERIFMATTEYKEHSFNSDFYTAEDLAAGAINRLALFVYDTTTDASTLVADRMHVFFDLTKPGVVQVGELFIISNPGAHMIVAKETGGPVLTFDLPAGASNLTFQDGELGGRYLKTDTGFGDTYSIQPGSGGHQVMFAYELPYDRKATVALPIPLPVGAAVVIMPAGGVKLESSQLMDMGEQEMQGLAMHLYTASAIPAGGSLEITLSGQVEDTASAAGASRTGLWVGIGSILLAVGVAGFWFYQKRREEASQEEEGDESADAGTVDDLLDAIVALDDLYQAGNLPQEAYEQRRAALKARLRATRQPSEQDS